MDRSWSNLGFRKLILLIFVFLCISMFSGGFWAIIIGLINIKFPNLLNIEEMIYISRKMGDISYVSISLYIMANNYKYKIYNLLKNVKLNSFGFMIISFILGVILMIISNYIYRSINGEVQYVNDLHMNIFTIIVIEILIGAVVIVIFEEVFFRGILFYSFRKRWSFYQSNLLSSLIFMLFHIEQYNDYSRLIFIFLVGFISSIFYEKTKLLHNSIIFHFSYNLTAIVSYYMYI